MSSAILIWFVLQAALWATQLTRGVAADTVATDNYAAARKRMVEEQHAASGRDITNRRVLAVMGKVPRHEFVPGDARPFAYADHPLAIGHGQTISQPFIVAFMTEKKKGNKVERRAILPVRFVPMTGEKGKGTP